MATKYEIYAELIALGVARGFDVIPEFSLALHAPHPGDPKQAHVDLVWARRVCACLQPGHSCRNNTPVFAGCAHPHTHECWEIVAIFEIEGADFSLGKKGMARHLRRNFLANSAKTACKYLVFYDESFDHVRSPHNPTLVKVSSRIDGFCRGVPNNQAHNWKLLVPATRPGWYVYGFGGGPLPFAVPAPLSVAIP